MQHKLCEKSSLHYWTKTRRTTKRIRTKVHLLVLELQTLNFALRFSLWNSLPKVKSTCVTGAWLVPRGPWRQVSAESRWSGAVGHIPQCTALQQTGPSSHGWAGIQTAAGSAAERRRLVSVEGERQEGVGLLVDEWETLKRFGLGSGKPWRRQRNIK